MTQHLPKLPFTARCIANHSTFDLNLSATYKALFFPLSTLSATIYMFQIVLFSFLRVWHYFFLLSFFSF